MKRHTTRRLISFALIMLCAIASSRYGILCTIHPWQTSLELDTGAIHIVHIAKGHSQAFAPTRIEFLDSAQWNFTGWQPKFEQNSPGITYAAIPLWLLALPLLAPIFLKKLRPARETTPTCQTCNYNLTGNQSGRCPECGNAILNDPRAKKGTPDRQPGVPHSKSIS